MQENTARDLQQSIGHRVGQEVDVDPTRYHALNALARSAESRPVSIDSFPEDSQIAILAERNENPDWFRSLTIAEVYALPEFLATLVREHHNRAEALDRFAMQVRAAAREAGDAGVSTVSPARPGRQDFPVTG